MHRRWNIFLRAETHDCATHRINFQTLAGFEVELHRGFGAGLEVQCKVVLTLHNVRVERDPVCVRDGALYAAPFCRLTY